MGFCFLLGGQPPLAAHPLSTSGGFSKRTLYPLLTCLPVPVHTVAIWAIFSVCRPDDRDPRSLLYWFGVQLIRWQRHLPAGPNVESHAGSLGRSSVLPPFSQSEWLEGTSPAESGSSVAPLPSNVGIHLKTSQHPHDGPFLGWVNP